MFLLDMSDVISTEVAATYLYPTSAYNLSRLITSSHCDNTCLTKSPPLPPSQPVLASRPIWLPV